MPKQKHDGVDGEGHDFLRSTPGDTAAGHAALLLVESLIHHLISIKILSVRDAIEIIDVAAEVENEVRATVADGMAPLLPPSSLTALANSLRFELKD